MTTTWVSEPLVATGSPHCASDSYLQAANAYVRVGDRMLAYRSVAQGRPLVLCNRFRATMDDWDPAFIDELAAQGLRVVTFDYSGLGLSSGQPNYAPTALAQDAHDLIAALQLPMVALGGWSVGGLAVQVAIAMFPHAISHAVLLAAVPPGPNVRGADPLFNTTALKAENDLADEQVLFFVPTSAASCTAAQQSRARMNLRRTGRCPAVPWEVAKATLSPTPRSPLFPADALLPALRHTRIPILHLGGDHDICFPVENWQAVQAQMPTLQLITLPQSGHGPHHQYPQLAARYIRTFLSTATVYEGATP